MRRTRPSQSYAVFSKLRRSSRERVIMKHPLLVPSRPSIARLRLVSTFGAHRTQCQLAGGKRGNARLAWKAFPVGRKCSFLLPSGTTPLRAYGPPDENPVPAESEVVIFALLARGKGLCKATCLDVLRSRVAIPVPSRRQPGLNMIDGNASAKLRQEMSLSHSDPCAPCASFAPKKGPDDVGCCPSLGMSLPLTTAPVVLGALAIYLVRAVLGCV